MTAVNQLFELIYGTVMAIIGLGGVAFGGWALYDGFTNDQPEAKKRDITTIIVALTIKEPVIVLRDAFVELVGGTHDDEEISAFVTREVEAHLPAAIEMEKVHVFKTGMNFDVDIFIGSTQGSVRMEELVAARQTIEKALEERLHIVNVDFVFE